MLTMPNGELDPELVIVLDKIIKCLSGSRVDYSISALLIAVGALSLINMTNDDKCKLVENVNFVPEEGKDINKET